MLFLEWGHFLFLPNWQQPDNSSELKPEVSLHSSSFLLLVLKNCIMVSAKWKLSSSIIRSRTQCAKTKQSDNMVRKYEMPQRCPPWTSEMLSSEMWKVICSAASWRPIPAGTILLLKLVLHRYYHICTVLQQEMGWTHSYNVCVVHYLYTQLQFYHEVRCKASMLTSPPVNFGACFLLNAL